MPAAEQLYTLASVVAQAAGDGFVENYLGTIIQTGIILVSIGAAYGFLKSGMATHDKRLTQVEKALEKMQDIMLLLARVEERYNAMDQRVLAHGKRMDDHQNNTAALIQSSASIVNSRLEAINNIVSGHTNQINSILERGRISRGSAG